MKTNKTKKKVKQMQVKTGKAQLYDLLGKFEVRLDVDTANVLAFMEETITPNKLVTVAEGIAKLAPILWGHLEVPDDSRYSHVPLTFNRNLDDLRRA